MSAPPEMTAAMIPPAEPNDPSHPAGDSPASGQSTRGASASAGTLDVGVEQTTRRRESPSNAVITLFGGLVTTLLGALIGLMMWQFNSLGARIDANSDRIHSLGVDLRAEIAATEGRLRAEIAATEGRLRAEIAANSERIDSLENSLRAEIAAMGDRIDSLENSLRAEIAAMGDRIDSLENSLRAELREFRAEFNEVALDHTQRLARLEAAHPHDPAGIPETGSAQDSAGGETR